MEKKARILVVDDDQQSLSVMAEALEKDGYHIARAQSGEDGLHKLKAWDPHLILLDINMPGMGGLKTLESIRATPDRDYIAIIFVTGNLTVEDIVAGLDAGADDYLVKPFRIPELLARVRAKLRIKATHDHLRRVMKRLEEMVETDDLTGLSNMRSMYSKVDTEMNRSKRYNKNLSLLMLDLDFFKNVNDQNDHLFGSWVLTEVARILKDNIRAVDVAARYGGDEYLIMLPETDLVGAERMGERLRKVIGSHTFVQGKQKAQITTSVGACAINASSKTATAKDFVREADQLLYEAKKAGRNCMKSKLAP
ncbi:MAG: diguanylate cyclase [Oligoflexia bacterium]|nr:diguanylate cyclase [Oligoflexia bacterium]